jgi:hypothetical protein
MQRNRWAILNTTAPTLDPTAAQSVLQEPCGETRKSFASSVIASVIARAKPEKGRERTKANARIRKP